MDNPVLDLAERFERRAKALRLLVDLVENDPEILGDLQRAVDRLRSRNFEAHSQDPARARPLRRRRSVVLESIQSFFAAHDNEWATTEQIIDGSGQNPNSVQHIMFHAHKDLFEAKELADSRAKLYRMAIR